MTVRRKVIFATFSSVLIAAFLWSLSSWPETYGHFRSRDVKYYGEFADACDQLRSRIPDSTNNMPADLIPYGASTEDLRDLQWQFQKRKLSADDGSLPPPIKKLKASYIEYDSNRVFIMIGVSRMGFSITWQQRSGSSDVWELATNGDGLQEVIFTRKRQVGVN